MFDFLKPQKQNVPAGVSRRDFLQMGTLAAGAVGTSLTAWDHARASTTATSPAQCIFLMLVGGPSQLDTWDPKPTASSTVRGPFRPLRTTVPGLHLCETFPRMAAMADRFAVIRSLHHHDAPIHEVGLQMMQTGRLCRELEYPHIGAVLSYLRPSIPGLPSFVVLPDPIGNTGVSISHGQQAGFLGAEHEPVQATVSMQSGNWLSDLSPSLSAAYNLAGESAGLRERYGRNGFGQSCLLARRLIEQGVDCVTVNMFDSVFHKTTWDCHADGAALPTTFADYRDTVCPMFDFAFTALLDDLSQRGLLDTTLVVATGEFGRTPHLNARGGRDHWPGVWSMLMAGAGVRGGLVVGSSDRSGGEPRDRPVTPADVAATVYRALGVPSDTELPSSDGRFVRLLEGEPIRKLF